MRICLPPIYSPTAPFSSSPSRDILYMYKYILVPETLYVLVCAFGGRGCDLVLTLELDWAIRASLPSPLSLEVPHCARCYYLEWSASFFQSLLSLRVGGQFWISPWELEFMHQHLYFFTYQTVCSL